MNIARLAGKFSFIAALTALSLVACGGDDDDGAEEGHADELAPACQEISDACHEVDMGEGRPAECHEVAHHNDADHCEAEKDACIADCEAAGG